MKFEGRKRAVIKSSESETMSCVVRVQEEIVEVVEEGEVCQEGELYESDVGMCLEMNVVAGRTFFLYRKTSRLA